MPAELRQQLAQRDEARTALPAAEGACDLLRVELDAATQAAEQTRRTIEAAGAGLLTFEAERIAQLHATLMQQTDACVAALRGFDRLISTRRLGRLPRGVADIIRAQGNHTTGANPGPWQALLGTLTADPSATTTIDLDAFTSVSAPPRRQVVPHVVERAVRLAKSDTAA